MLLHMKLGFGSREASNSEYLGKYLALYSFATKVFRSVSKRLVSAQKCNFYGLKFFIFTFLSGNHP